MSIHISPASIEFDNSVTLTFAIAKIALLPTGSVRVMTSCTIPIPAHPAPLFSDDERYVFKSNSNPRDCAYTSQQRTAVSLSIKIPKQKTKKRARCILPRLQMPMDPSPQRQNKLGSAHTCKPSKAHGALVVSTQLANLTSTTVDWEGRLLLHCMDKLRNARKQAYGKCLHTTGFTSHARHALPKLQPSPTTSPA